MSEDWIGWHFLPPDGCLANTEPKVKVEVGQTYRVDGDLQLCARGLHASRRAIGALDCAPGAIVCLVRLSGTVLQDDDKACAAERTVLAMADATNLLFEFGCWAATQALMAERDRGREPDSRSWAAIEARRAWLRGEIDDQQLTAAREAAWGAAREAAWAAARAAPWEAAWGAAWGAARAAAEATARKAAEATAREAAWAAAEAAAEATARKAARAAARAGQNDELGRRLAALLGVALRAGATTE